MVETSIYSAGCTCGGGGGGNAVIVLGAGAISSVRCAADNIASGCASTSLGQCNTSSGNFGSVTGGFANNVASQFAFIGNGSYNNVLTAPNGSVLSGFQNDVCGAFGTILNGCSNEAASGSQFGFIGNGCFHSVLGRRSSIINGIGNRANNGGFIGGGENNVSEGTNSFIVSGRSNYISEGGCLSGIGNGYGNRIYGIYSGIVNGCENYLNSCLSFIGSGSQNAIFNTVNGKHFIGTGAGQTIDGASSDQITLLNGSNSALDSCRSQILHGNSNCLNNACYSTILQGCNNTIYTSFNSTIINGCFNTIEGGDNNDVNGSCNVITGGSACSTIFNGYCNTVTASIGSTLNGRSNAVSNSGRATVFGAYNYIDAANESSFLSSQVNANTLSYSHVFGQAHVLNNLQNTSVFGNCQRLSTVFFGFSNGRQNEINNTNHGTILNGYLNTVCTAPYGTVINGTRNSALGTHAVVINGTQNNSCAKYASIINGYCNKAYQEFATVLNGCCNSSICDFTITSGFGALAHNFGQLSRTASNFSGVPGSTQHVEFTLSKQGDGIMGLDGGLDLINLLNDTIMYLQLQIFGANVDASVVIGQVTQVAYANVAGVATTLDQQIIDSFVVGVLTPSINVSINASNQIEISVNGDGENLRFTAFVSGVEMKIQ